MAQRNGACISCAGVCVFVAILLIFGSSCLFFVYLLVFFNDSFILYHPLEQVPFGLLYLYIFIRLDIVKWPHNSNGFRALVVFFSFCSVEINFKGKKTHCYQYLRWLIHKNILWCVFFFFACFVKNKSENALFT